MTIVERALEFVPDGADVGLGSGRAALAFVRLLGERVRAGGLRVRGVPTSTATEQAAAEAKIPLTTLADAGELVQHRGARASLRGVDMDPERQGSGEQRHLTSLNGLGWLSPAHSRELPRGERPCGSSCRSC